MKVERTKKGLPALWERGGGYSNTGEATIIASSNGGPMRPVYIRGRGHLACGDHALFVIKEGTVVVEANHHRLDFEITVSRIVGIDGDEARTEVIARFSEGEWEPELPPQFEQAVEAAEAKAAFYHCREPYYFK